MVVVVRTEKEGVVVGGVCVYLVVGGVGEEDPAIGTAAIASAVAVELLAVGEGLELTGRDDGGGEAGGGGAVALGTEGVGGSGGQVGDMIGVGGDVQEGIHFVAIGDVHPVVGGGGCVVECAAYCIVAGEGDAGQGACLDVHVVDVEVVVLILRAEHADGEEAVAGSVVGKVVSEGVPDVGCRGLEGIDGGECAPLAWGAHEAQLGEAGTALEAVAHLECEGAGVGGVEVGEGSVDVVGVVVVGVEAEGPAVALDGIVLVVVGGGVGPEGRTTVVAFAE